MLIRLQWSLWELCVYPGISPLDRQFEAITDLQALFFKSFRSTLELALSRFTLYHFVTFSVFLISSWTAFLIEVPLVYILWSSKYTKKMILIPKIMGDLFGIDSIIRVLCKSPVDIPLFILFTHSVGLIASLEFF